MAVTDLVPSAVDPQVSAAIELKGRLDPLRNALGLNDLTNDEMSLFAMVALRMRLDPFAKQIYAIKRKGKVTFQTGIDGFRSRAEETGQYRGSSEPTYGEWVEKPYPHPATATVVVHRQVPDGSMVNQSSTVWWDEFVADPGPSGNGDLQWRKMPRVMLAKVAEAAAFRKAFPQVFGGVYEPAEMDQDREAAAQARPVGQTAAERAQARLAAVTGTEASVTTTEAVTQPTAPAEAAPVPEAASAPPPETTDLVQCDATSPYDGNERCRRELGHAGLHQSSSRESWAS
jgi:phage recombination protein Bet